MTQQVLYNLDHDAARVDIIGDIHGCALTLERLLIKLGYSKQQGVYRHRSRKVVFVGDIVDRGPRIREALALVRDMVEAGAAYLILGNHEVHAYCYCTAHPTAPGNYLRPHTPRNTAIVAETLEQFANHSDDWRDHLQWISRLPLYLANEHMRVVHACWDAQIIEKRDSDWISTDQWRALADPGSDEARAIKRLTSGIDLPLPNQASMLSADGCQRTSFRARFWPPVPESYADLAFQPDPLPPDLGSLPLDPALNPRLVVYDSRQPPLFLGHYWLSGKPSPVAPNIACLDYGAVRFGRLVAYRHDGKPRLSPDNFVWVYVDP
ncbi:metallophosphoesterase [Gilvimarinus sp. DA14]|uniref:metallophosphoesterase n=1 Tax=Gilvimarinus sp. DA14 TaxID=2956798 RepID=UPI0020B7537F|nr:metallophosphoesterase [Gilvimarinus sp. DA14]UTF60714.1 metallophosphoesterase [Gilvimarinus sp. DA14]